MLVWVMIILFDTNDDNNGFINVIAMFKKHANGYSKFTCDLFGPR